jgi:hypothetical protein
MHIAWDSLLIVFVVSFAAAVAVVVLVSFALVSLSHKGQPSIDGVPATASGSASGKAIAGACLGAAGLIVLYGLYIIVR